MPRYYFDIQDKTGELYDELGEKLPDETAATREAVKVATSIARDIINSDGSLVVSVRRNNEKLLELTLTITIDRGLG